GRAPRAAPGRQLRRVADQRSAVLRVGHAALHDHDGMVAQSGAARRRSAPLRMGTRGTPSPARARTGGAVGHTLDVMRTAVLDAPRTVSLRMERRPAPASGEVRIRLEGSGVCGSNLAVWQGQPWFDYPLHGGAPGHEGWG